MDLALVTCAELPEPDFDAEPLAAALDAAGIRSDVWAWDDRSVDWSRARMVVLRSAWNYPLHHEAFASWAEKAAQVTDLWNPLPLVRWNIHKRYLIDLERQGVPITPTELVARGSDETLESILARRGWNDAVVKPAVSAASYRTLRANDDSLAEAEAHLRSLAIDRDVLVQRYLPSVEDYGERALVWIDGELTHAVRKTPRFSGEDESVSGAMDISQAEAALADRVLAAVDSPMLYGRIDVAPGFDGEPVVMELELIEPSLFFAQSSYGLERFVRGIERRLRILSDS